VKRLIEIGDVFVRSINCEDVLDQIVCSHAQEIGFASKYIGHQRSCRHFDHDADRKTGVVLDVRVGHLLLNLCDYSFGFTQFIYRTDQRRKNT